MSEVYLYSAIGTPLDGNEALHSQGLRAQLEDHAKARIDGILVAGTMGLMPLLTGAAYADLAYQAVEFWKGKGEVLIGVGDQSFARTRERIRMVNELRADGVVALPPYFVKFTQEELVEYYQSLAADASSPLYLYDLPQRTGVALSLETVRRLAEHPNIAGIKCSGDVTQTRQLIDALAGSTFRVIVAQASLMDYLIRGGIREFLDGVYCIAPRLARGIVDAAREGDWQTAAERMQTLNGLSLVLHKYGVFPTTTVLLNHRGIPGNFAPRPHKPLSPQLREQLLNEPATRAVLSAA
jgi:4-hydroxy-tetrahydrodipicolinate synthase